MLVYRELPKICSNFQCLKYRHLKVCEFVMGTDGNRKFLNQKTETNNLINFQIKLKKRKITNFCYFESEKVKQKTKNLRVCEPEVLLLLH